MEEVLFFYLFYNIQNRAILERIKSGVFNNQYFDKRYANVKYSTTSSPLSPKNIFELAINAECFIKKNLYPEFLNFDLSIHSGSYNHNSKLNLITLFYYNKSHEEIFGDYHNLRLFYLDLIIEYANVEKKNITSKKQKNTYIAGAGIRSNHMPRIQLDNFSHLFLSKLETQFDLKKYEFNNKENLFDRLNLYFKYNEIFICKLKLAKLFIDYKKITVDSYKINLEHGFKLNRDMNQLYNEIQKNYNFY